MAIKYLDDTGLARLVADVKSYVGTQIGAIPNISYEVVNSLPTAGATYYFNTSKTVYLAPKSTAQTNNTYDEYICTRSGTEGSYTYAWEKIGDTEIDLSGYMTTTNPTGTGSFSLNRASGTSVGTNSVAVGYNTTASAQYSVASGVWTVASGDRSHVEGEFSTASGGVSHAEGHLTTASGSYSHSEGFETTAQRRSQHVFGEYNVLDTTGTTTTRGSYIEIVGNGTASDAKSNARTLDWSGNEYLAGTLQTTGLKDGNNANYKLKIPTTTSWTADKTIATTDDVSTKQDTLISGTNLKTINNTSLLGSGNITISGGSATDVQVDSVSITSNNVADLKTINGNYNASTNKIATASDLSGKVSTTSTASKVYATDGNGNQTTINYDTISDFSMNNIVRRIGQQGNIVVPETPQANVHATSKKYVDGLKMIPSDNTATYSTAPTTGTTVMTAPANGVAYVRYALTGSGSIGLHLQSSSGTDLAYNTQNFDTNGYHVYTATFVMKSGQKLYCYENALSNNWGAIIFVKSEGQS